LLWDALGAIGAACRRLEAGARRRFSIPCPGIAIGDSAQIEMCAFVHGLRGKAVSIALAVPGKLRTVGKKQNVLHVAARARGQ